MTPTPNPTPTPTDRPQRWSALGATSGVPTFVGLATAGLGFVLLLVGWGQVAGETAVALQLPYVVSAGLIGLALVMTGIVVVTVQAKRRDSATLEGQLDELALLLGRLADAVPHDDGDAR